MIRLITTLSMLSVLAAVPAWGTTPIFTCGELVASGDTGILQNDLSCGGTVGVSLGPRATLQLNGHSISGAGDGVLCAGRGCTVEGPGEIAGSTGCAVTVQPAVGRVRIIVRDDVAIHDNACAIAGPNREDLSVSLGNVQLTDNGSGISANTVRGTDVIVTGTGADGVFVRRAVNLRRATLQNNGGIGVFSWERARLRETMVTGNDPVNGFDVATHRRPRLVDSTCGKSAQVPEFPGAPDAGSPSWGVCLND